MAARYVVYRENDQADFIDTGRKEARKGGRLHCVASKSRRRGPLAVLAIAVALMALGHLPVGVGSSYAAASSAGKYSPERGGRSRCERVEIEMCKDVGYNFTDLNLSPSNILLQSDASARMNIYKLLVDSSGLNCSSYLKLLVCSVYAPICFPHSNFDQFLPPCRFICERARELFVPIIRRYSIKFEWPPLLACDNFPVYSPSSQMCFHNPSHVKEDRSCSFADVRVTEPPKSAARSSSVPTSAPLANATGSEDSSSCSCACHPPMVAISDAKNPLYQKVSTGGVDNCAIPCRSPYFSEERRRFAESWIASWSIVCFVVTLVTVCTFLIDTQRFNYPERPVIFLSACYMFVSIGFLIRVVAGHDAVACSWSQDHVLYKTTGPFLCSIVFLLIYFFGMAGALWWVVLALTWFLAAGLKRGSEAIASYSNYFHAAAWIIPALKSITVLAMSSVDGDSLSGICYVGNQDAANLRGFVSTPLLVYLSLGGLFLLLGFINLFRMRKSMQKGGKERDTLTLERYMDRIGLFSLLYMIPSAALLACYFYELHNKSRWAKAHNCGAACNYSAPEPEFAVFIVKYSMMLLIGVTNGVWVCSGKTVTSWRRFYVRCRDCLFAGGKKSGGVQKERSVECSDTSFVTESANAAANLGDASDGSREIAPPSPAVWCSRDDECTDAVRKPAKKSDKRLRRASSQSRDPSAGTDSSGHRRSPAGHSSANSASLVIPMTPQDATLLTALDEPFTVTALPYSNADAGDCLLCQHAAVDAEDQPWKLVLCDPAGVPLVDGYLPFVEADSPGRVQHIHHHHHHHVAKPCACECHGSRGHRRSTRHARKSAHAHEQRGFRITPPAERGSGRR